MDSKSRYYFAGVVGWDRSFSTQKNSSYRQPFLGDICTSNNGTKESKFMWFNSYSTRYLNYKEVRQHFETILEKKKVCRYICRYDYHSKHCPIHVHQGQMGIWVETVVKFIQHFFCNCVLILCNFVGIQSSWVTIGIGIEKLISTLSGNPTYW